MDEPSDDAKYLSSDWKPSAPNAEKTFGILLDAERRRVDQLQLLVHRNGKRIFIELRSPAVAISLDRRQLNRRGLRRRVRLCHRHRLARNAGDLFGGHQRRGRKSPLPFDDDADAEPEAVLVRDERHFVGDVAAAFRRKPVAGELIAITPDAQVGVSRALLLGLRDRHRAQLLQLGLRLRGIRLRRPEKPVRQKRRNRSRDKRPACCIPGTK